LFWSFNIRKDFADTNPEITQKVIIALDRAVEFTNKNPEEAKEMMKKYLHESQQPFIEFYPDALYKETTKIKEQEFQEIADKYLDVNIINEPIDVTNLVITKDFLTENKLMIEIKNLSKSYNRKINEFEIKIWYSALRISLPLFVAIEKKLFKKEKLKVKLERFDNAQPLVNALISGNIQAGGYSALPIAFQWIESKWVELSFITSLMEDSSHRISYFISSDLKKSPNDRTNISGKRIWILPTTAYNIWIKQILIKKNINLNDIEIIEVPLNKQIHAIQKKEIDFLFTSDPVATTIIKNNPQKYFFLYFSKHLWKNYK